MISSTFPYPPSLGGTQVRTFHLLNYLHRFHTVTLVTQTTEDVTTGEIEALMAYTTELQIFSRPLHPSKPSIYGKVERFINFLHTGTPPNVASRYSPQMQAWIDQAIAEGNYDVITSEHSVNEIYIRPEFPLKKVVNIHSSIYATSQQQIITKTSENPPRDRLQLPLLKAYEKAYLNKFNHLVVTTETDKKSIQALNNNLPITVIPNGVDLEKFPYRSLDPGGYQLIFAGAMDNIANIDAACFLSQEILPPIQQIYPQTQLILVGANPSPTVQALAKLPGVQVMGKVESMVKFLHQATVCVIPMRIGFGIKNKTLEAMAAGIPVVASNQGLEGIPATTGPTALRANHPQEYIQAIISLLENPNQRQQLSQNARKLIETTYTWERVGKDYQQVLMSKL